MSDSLEDKNSDWIIQEHFNGVENIENGDIEKAPVEEENTEVDDAFSSDNIGTIQFIQLSRIYDVLIAILTLQDKDVAKDLLELHSQGNIVTPQPVFNGNFISDLLNADTVPPSEAADLEESN